MSARTDSTSNTGVQTCSKAQRHGGTAEAFSDGAAHGSRFVVTLPADASFANRKAGDKRADLAVFAGARVLLVEHSDESLQAMSELFSLQTHRYQLRRMQRTP
jgi:two-component system CheB/CheR fusion protein